MPDGKPEIIIEEAMINEFETSHTEFFNRLKAWNFEKKIVVCFRCPHVISGRNKKMLARFSMAKMQGAFHAKHPDNRSKETERIVTELKKIWQAETKEYAIIMKSGALLYSWMFSRHRILIQTKVSD